MQRDEERPLACFDYSGVVMAGPIAVQVDGLRDLRRELRRAGDQFPRELREANLEAAQVAVPFVRRFAPVGPHQGGGSVRPIIASIRAGASQRAGYVAAGGARTPHAAVWQWGGTIPRRGQTNARTRIPGRHYMDRGVEAATDEVLEVYDAALARLVRRAFPN
jgi:hypothetical protein